MSDKPGLLSRREFIRNTALLGGGAVVGGLTVLSVRQLAEAGPEAGLAPVRLPAQERAVRVDDLDGDAVQVVTGEWGDAPAVVYKVRRSALEAAREIRGRDTLAFAVAHPSESDHMIVAYDARCTHLGCTVGWASHLGASADVADYDGDGEPDGRILCPCHQAQFDIHDLGTHLENTPAPRPLPVLVIEVHEGEVWARRRIDQQAPGDALNT